jgi:hypothetical protein
MPPAQAGIGASSLVNMKHLQTIASSQPNAQFYIVVAFFANQAFTVNRLGFQGLQPM